MSDDFTANATDPDREDVATQPLHEQLLTLGAQWRGQPVAPDRLVAHISALATRDHLAMPARGYPQQQAEFVLTDAPPRPRLAPRRYVISAVAAVVVIALLSAAFLVVMRKVPGTRLPVATLPVATTTFANATHLPFTVTAALPTNVHPLRVLHMLDATTGWAQTDQQILRTTDGGLHWQDVTPPGIAFPLQPPQALFYTTFDAMTAWATDGKTIYRTTNAGQTWLAASPPVEKAIGYLTFVDALHGWAVDFLGFAANHEGLHLLRTVDGGASWARVTTTDDPGGLPFVGDKSAPTFVNAATGWIGGEEPMDNLIYFYVTRDSGVTWQQQTLPRPTTQNFQMAINAPIFFDAQAGVLTANVSLAPTYATGGIYIYVTSDGGASWFTAGTAVPSDFGAPDFLDMHHWWAVGGQNGNDLAYSEDGGQHWNTIFANGAGSVGTFDGVTQVDFISATTGWAIAGNAGAQPTTLLQTTDGGHTWQRISYQIG